MVDIQTSKRIMAIMTCHNRCNMTMKSIKHYFDSKLPKNIVRDLILVDDGSTDGTSQAVRAEFPGVIIEKGDGNLFWNRGMYLAMERGLEHDPDYLLWLNDDTLLHSDSLNQILKTEYEQSMHCGNDVIVVGSTIDTDTERLSYGGYVTPQFWRPFRFHRVWSEDEAVECDAMNGNIVLIPTKLAKTVGNLDPTYTHAMGDIDYALRARAMGFHVFTAPGISGSCSINSNENTYKDSSLPLSVRWKKIKDRKGLPIQSWLHFTRKHGGLVWPIYFIWPYLKLIIFSKK